MAFGVIVPYSQVSKLVSVKVNASGFLSLGLDKTSNYKISDKPEPKYSIQKSDGLACWRYHYYVEHPLTDVISEPRDCNKQRPKVSLRYDPLGRRISKTSQQLLQGRPSGNAVTTRFVWEGYRLLQKIHNGIPLTYVYSDSQSYEPLARIDGVDESPEIYWFHNAANGMPELLTDGEGQKAWEGINSPGGKLLRETSQRVPLVEQNLRMQGQYLDRD